MQQNNTTTRAIFHLIALCFLLFTLFQSCSDHTEPFIPERQESIGEDQYETRRKKLVEAYEAEIARLTLYALIAYLPMLGTLPERK